VARLFGSRGAIDFWLATNVDLQEGWVGFECVLPIPVGADRLDALSELCAWLSAGSRVGFTVDHARPCGCTGADVRLCSVDVAADQILGALEVLWQRMSGFASAFHGVADGQAPEEALATITEEMSHLVGDRPWLGGGPTGTMWPVTAETTPSLPADMGIPDGYTAAEYAATLMTLERLAPSERVVGVLDACAGPVLIHSDGTVECYGCSIPATPHVPGIAVACDWGVRLGDGHVCDRCRGGAGT
jgi:hypothetical protein